MFMTNSSLVLVTVFIICFLTRYLTTLSGLYCIFFFSSRRRHTRCSRDWSSDVCSSDLKTRLKIEKLPRRNRRPDQPRQHNQIPRIQVHVWNHRVLCGNQPIGLGQNGDRKSVV